MLIIDSLGQRPVKVSKEVQAIGEWASFSELNLLLEPTVGILRVQAAASEVDTSGPDARSKGTCFQI